MNSASVIVQLQATEVTASSNMTNSQNSTDIPPPKPPEEMQKEAQDNGTLSTWHEFSWCYPWYRMHIQVHVNPTIDIGFNPLLPGGETYSWNGLEVLASVLTDVVEDITLDIVAMFAQYLIAKAFEYWNPVAGFITETAKFFVQLALLVWREWDDRVSLLISTIVNIIMGFTALVIDFGRLFLKALFAIAGKLTSTASMLAVLFNRLSEMLVLTRIVARGWIDVLEAVYDWIIAGIALYRWSCLR